MKRCPGPLYKGEFRPFASFGPHGTRLQSYCCGCNNWGHRLKRRGNDSDATMVTVPPIIELEPDLEFDRREASAESEEHPQKRRRVDDSLYIMEIDPGDEADRRLCREVFGLKIGRTWDVDERCKSMARSMPFRMRVLAEFPGAANIEHDIHEDLAEARNHNGLGHEWFRSV